MLLESVGGGWGGPCNGSGGGGSAAADEPGGGGGGVPALVGGVHVEVAGLVLALLLLTAASCAVFCLFGAMVDTFGAAELLLSE